MRTIKTKDEAKLGESAAGILAIERAEQFEKEMRDLGAVSAGDQAAQAAQAAIIGKYREDMFGPAGLKPLENFCSRLGHYFDTVMWGKWDGSVAYPDGSPWGIQVLLFPEAAPDPGVVVGDPYPAENGKRRWRASKRQADGSVLNDRSPAGTPTMIQGVAAIKVDGGLVFGSTIQWWQEK